MNLLSLVLGMRLGWIEETWNEEKYKKFCLQNRQKSFYTKSKKFFAVLVFLRMESSLKKTQTHTEE